MRIDVDEVCRRLLARGCSEADLDAHLTSVCRELYSEQGPAAARAVGSAIERFSEHAGGTRLGAVRLLSEGQASVVQHSYGSLDEMPPGVRKRFEVMRGTGALHTEREIVVKGQDGLPRDVPPDVLDEMRRALDGPPGTWSKHVGIGRRYVNWRKWGLVGCVLLLCLVPGLFQIYATVRRAHVNKGMRAVANRVERLEAEFAKHPDDVATGVELAGEYVARIVYVRSVMGMRNADIGGESEDDALAAAVNANLSKFEEQMGMPATEQTLVAAAAKGEELARALLARSNVGDRDAASLQIVLGHCLLAQGRPDEARAASDAAAAVDADDVRPHLLNAAIFEGTGDYDGAIREDQAALRKLKGWVDKGPSLLHAVVWGMSPTGREDAASWRRHKEQTVQRITLSIESHIVTLRVLKSARKRGIDVGV